jgi:hypothetical protein
VSRQTILGPLQGTIDELGINYLVAEDSDRDTWDAYGMRAYPSWAFINADGSLGGRGVGKVTDGDAPALIEQALGA